MSWTDRQVDEALSNVTRRHGAIDLAIGETLMRLLAGVRLLRLGYATGRDYARERLGIPARMASEALALARACAGRPMLRKAVAAGLVTPMKARAISPVVDEDEPLWTTLAVTSGLHGLRAAVRAAGKHPPAEPEARVLWLRMPEEQQARLDRALALAGEGLRDPVRRWQRLGAMANAWLADHGDGTREVGGARGPAPVRARARAPRAQHRRTIEGAVPLFEDSSPLSDVPSDLDARALRLLRARRRYDGIFGALAARAVGERIWASLGYPSLEEYCRERLGTSDKTVRERASLERRMCALAELRRAYETLLLTYTKALLVAREAHRGNVAELVERAAATTWQQTEREVSLREERRNRALGLRCLWAPKVVGSTLARAIRGAQAWSASRGSRIGPGEAVALIADHFVEVAPSDRSRRGTPLRRRVLMRARGICAVPGCSLVARHVHHVRHRSDGGSDVVWNLVGLCASHHLRAIHHGYLTVEGSAGGRLVWRFPTGEVFVTRGSDDVRRGEGERVSEGGCCDGAPDGVISCDVPPAFEGITGPLSYIYGA